MCFVCSQEASNAHIYKMIGHENETQALYKLQLPYNSGVNILFLGIDIGVSKFCYVLFLIKPLIC